MNNKINTEKLINLFLIATVNRSSKYVQTEVRLF